jgi:hypothetical protein
VVVVVVRANSIALRRRRRRWHVGVRSSEKAMAPSSAYVVVVSRASASS